MTDPQTYFAWWPQVSESESKLDKIVIDDNVKQVPQNMYWNFDPSVLIKWEWENNEVHKVESNSWDIEWREINYILFEHISYPILKRYEENWRISINQLEKILNNLKEDNNIEKALSVIENSELRLEIINLINKIDNNNIEDNKKDFLEDFNEIAWEKVNLDIDNTLNIIAENYIKISDGKWWFDINEDFSTAVKISAIKILKVSTNINRDTQAFRTAMERVNSWNHVDEYLWIRYLLKESSIWTWKRVQKKDQRIKIKTEERERAFSLSEQFEKIKGRFKKAKEEENYTELKVILIELQKLREENSWEDGDVFVISKLDIMAWEIQDIIKKM